MASSAIQYRPDIHSDTVTAREDCSPYTPAHTAPVEAFKTHCTPQWPRRPTARPSAAAGPSIISGDVYEALRQDVGSTLNHGADEDMTSMSGRLRRVSFVKLLAEVVVRKAPVSEGLRELYM